MNIYKEIVKLNDNNQSFVIATIISPIYQTLRKSSAKIIIKGKW